ncbi:Gfo/Idh/MocA family protein [Kineococcus rhizosphaerae]|uniref:Putative dehydrogenase n=1 Tax=Kineococcus rhizosphaerae TaxID=559628 RepID=A0A2T0R8F3_9ACTN|nr:Gfo/Idh/MocA family oxidoreductase [Kineococcus rhizosphaerae]PRY17456.1 putative dehydrogenase [Kineococcus rhizosphaerae]
MTDTTFALVGYGGGARFFHAPVIEGAVGARLGFVVTTNPERAAQARAEHEGVTVVASLAEAVAGGAQAVAISTPLATHTALTEEAIGLGVAVVCDKPFAADAATARDTVRRAEAAGVLLSPYQNRRWDSDLLTVRRLLADGELGDVVRFESAFERWAPGDPPAAGGGLLRDFGAHLVDQVLHLFGPVRTVAAQTRGGAGAEHDLRVQLEHVGGVRSELSGSWKQPVPAPRFRVSGTRGTFVLDSPMDVQEETLLAGRTPTSEGAAWGAEPPSRWGTLAVGGGGVHRVPSEQGRWPDFYTAFAAAVRGEGPVPVDPWDAVATCTVVDAALASAESGATVRLTE